MANAYTERLVTIMNICEKLNIPCGFDSIGFLDGGVLRFPWSAGDIACHAWTYDADNGMVESYRFSWDGDDVSVLTVEEAVVYIILEYNNYKKSKN